MTPKAALAVESLSSLAVACVAVAAVAAVAAQKQVLVSDMGLPGRDLFLVLAGSHEKEWSDKDLVFVPQSGSLEEGLASVPQVEVFHLRHHGILAASHCPGHDGTCYKNSGHNADHNGGRANRDIFA